MHEAYGLFPRIILVINMCVAIHKGIEFILYLAVAVGRIKIYISRLLLKVNDLTIC